MFFQEVDGVFGIVMLYIDYFKLCSHCNKGGS